jgi:hypothetical protein
MAIHPHRIVRPWTWRPGMDYGGARNEGKKNKKEKTYFDKG